MSRIPKLMVLFLTLLGFSSAFAAVYQCPQQMVCVKSPDPIGVACSNPNQMKGDFEGSVDVPKDRTLGTYVFTGVKISSGVSCNYIVLGGGTATIQITSGKPMQKAVPPKDSGDSAWGMSVTQCGDLKNPIDPLRCHFQDKKVSSNSQKINVAFNLKSH